MRERPILFSGPMVRAILEGRKSQTRRVVRGDFDLIRPSAMTTDGKLLDSHWTATGPAGRVGLVSPFGIAGHRLWVRETWAPMCRVADPYCECESPEAIAANHYVEYRADTGNPYPGDWPAEEGRENDDAPRWRPSIHMPRSASRLTLEITGVRVERLQAISEADAIAEGANPSDATVIFRDHERVPTIEVTPRGAFACLWDDINAARGFGWDANPWVWVIDFRRVS